MADAHNTPYAGEIIHASDITNILSSYVTDATLNDTIASVIGGISSRNKPPVNWTIANKPTLDAWYVHSICYGDGKFVAAGSGGIAYSTDGINWTKLPYGITTPPDFRAICYGNRMFVAGREMREMACSTNGIDWDPASTDSNSFGYVRSICYGDGRYVAVGEERDIAYSTDGTDWISIDIASSNPELWTSSVCYGNGKFVVVGTDRSVAYSTDGTSWTEVDKETLNFDGYSVCYGNGKFVAGCSEGKIVYSTDGINWTAVANPIFSTSVDYIYYGNGTFVAISSESTSKPREMAYSTDGINWTSIDVSAFEGYPISSVCYGNGKYVASGNDSHAYTAVMAYSCAIEEIRDFYYYVPKDCKAGDTVILDGIECLCVATGVTIQGSPLTRIAVDKNHDLGYYQKYVGMNIDGATISTIVEWRWGGYYTRTGTSNKEGYGLQNTIKCLANTKNYTKGGSSDNSNCPLMWLGVNDFRSSHSDKWFVPSANELKNYVYPYKSSLTFDTTTGGPSTDYFWSSSEYDGDYANYVEFKSGVLDEFAKFAALSVRLCRAF